METQKIEIAIIILNLNGKNWLEKFLPTTIKYSEIAEIIVADNGSNDDSIDFLKDKYSNIKIIYNKNNYGYAGGYNKALKSINSNYYILLNSDVQVSENWIEPIISLMEKNKNIAACQPKILDYKIKNRFEYAGACGGYIDLFGYPFCRGRIFEHLEEDYLQYNNSLEVFWATGACLFIRSDAFWEIDGFDEDFFAHQEEIDLCWRLKNNGYKIMVEPKSKVFHVGGGTLNANSSYKTYLNFRNNLFMLIKNMKFSEILIIIPLRLILDAIAAISFLNQKNGVSHLIAIVKAHIIFYFSIPKLIIKHNKIIQRRELSGKKNYSIIIKNKIQGIKRFSDL